MQVKQSHLFLLAGLAIIAVLLTALSSILLPFVLGFAIAYWLDPLADGLEKLGLHRIVATALITLVFFALVILGLAFGAPFLVDQIALLVNALPRYTQALEAWLAQQQLDGLAGDAMASINRAASEGLSHLGQTLLLSGLSVLNILSFLFITPIVAIYMLNDWDRMVTRIDGLLPHQQAGLMRDLARQMDMILSGFLRGQALVCLSLALIYAVGLALVGLDGAVVLGVIAGLISFVPYVGAAFGVIAALLLGLGQFGLDYVMGLQLLAVFAVGQFIEGNILTPRLVGERVQLHPVWIIFALLAMSQLFGFLGLLLAVPVAAICGVLVRHATGVYARDYVNVKPDGGDG